MARRIAVLLGIGFVTALASVPTSDAAAQVGTGVEQIQRYEVDLTIFPAGDLRIVETIAYDFGANDRHGIQRDIPTRERYDSRRDRVYPITVESVTASAGTPSGFKVLSIDGGQRIRVGDPDRTITGVHTYTVTYTVRGALNAFDDHDELYWNVVGDGWSVPIHGVTARVQAPDAITRSACYAGPTGSRLSCDAAVAAGREASFSQAALGAYEGTTVVIALAKGAISPPPTPILRERWTPAQAFEITPVTVGFAGALLVALLGGIGWLVYSQGRDRRAIGSHVDVAFATGIEPDERVPLWSNDETPVEFEPPEGIRPGQLGTLIDETANALDVTATIVDLAVRGCLRIEETREHRWYRKGDWKLTRVDTPEGLLEYERILLDGLFEDGEEVALSDLRTHFAPRLARVQQALYRDGIAQRWFAEDPDRIRKRWKVVGWVVAGAGAGLTVAAAAFTGLGLVPIPLVLGGLVLTRVARAMPSRTAKGTAVLRRVAGFRRFITSPTELAHARFDESRTVFSELLPFAIVFGCVERWAEAFEALDAAALDTSGWYRSSEPFSVLAFSSSIDHFATMTTGTVAATAASSSGGSGFGGGSSGGGGGGGGGGSW